MRQIFVIFSSVATAEYLVAGIPAAARAAQAIASLTAGDDIDHCLIVAGRLWNPGADVLHECARLAPGLRIAFSPQHLDDRAVRVRGERLVAEIARVPGTVGRDDVLWALAAASLRPPRPASGDGADEHAGIRQLRRASRDILAKTGKAGDGIVSRYVNRPISRAISGVLLRVPGVMPWHASIGTAALGIAMTLALILGDEFGLVAGALLFQAASIFDGVDGEMARAAERTSSEGAALDSVIDAFINVAFVTGVAFNVSLSGDLTGAAAGGVALVALASGLFAIGVRVNATGEPMNFDIVKRHFRREGRSSAVTEWLIYLTMRDFFAAASAIMILAGQTQLLLILFAGIATGWLVITLTVLRRTGRGPAAAAALSQRIVTPLREA